MRTPGSIFSLLVALVTTSSIGCSPSNINLSKLVNEINSNAKSTWQASSYGYAALNRQNFLDTKFGTDFAEIIELMEMKQDKKVLNEYLNLKKYDEIEDETIPKSFDARTKYPPCRSIRHVWDQSNCASCWAISASSVLSDRLCILTKGEQNVLPSVEHLIACNKENRGCKGGGLFKTWQYLQTNGTVTGGDYHSDEGCQPYNIRPCGWPHRLPCKFSSSRTPKCKNTKCSNEWYDDEYEKNIIKANSFYPVSNISLGILNEISIMKEIFNNGPVQAVLLVYEDFLTYKSGIYKHNEAASMAPPLSGLSVKIIGWGKEDDTRYWTAVNSWGDEWGEDGTFKIVRGENECLIETLIYAGVPKPIAVQNL